MKIDRKWPIKPFSMKNQKFFHPFKYITVISQRELFYPPPPPPPKNLYIELMLHMVKIVHMVEARGTESVLVATLHPLACPSRSPRSYPNLTLK